MNWETMDFDWNQAKAFLVTAKTGSYSAAATQLGLSQPTLSRQVAGLEESLGIALFERSGRGIQLTPSGLELMGYVETMGQAATDLSFIAESKSTTLNTKVSISAPEVTCYFVLPLVLKELKLSYPEIEIQIIASNEASDLRQREADIAIRSYRPTELEFYAKRLPGQYWGLFATKEYLDIIDQDKSDKRYELASYIGFTDKELIIAPLKGIGIDLSESNFKFCSDNMLIQMELIKQGYGIGILPVECEAQTSNLKRVLKEKANFNSDQWLISHRDLKSQKGIWAVFEFLSSRLSKKDL